MKLLIQSLLSALFLTGCDPISFGEDVDLSGTSFTAAKLAEVSSVTGIIFPVGSTGMDYFYQGSGIDDALATKIKIPAESKDEFLKNQVFVIGKNSKPSCEIGRGKSWWHPEVLIDRVDRVQELAPARFLEVSFGTDNSDCIVYLSWITT